MKITVPCYRPEQLSMFGKKRSAPYRHRWKDGACIHCGVQRSGAIVDACDCGCKTVIRQDTETTQYGKLTFVFGHETGDLFEEIYASPISLHSR